MQLLGTKSSEVAGPGLTSFSARATPTSRPAENDHPSLMTKIEVDVKRAGAGAASVGYIGYYEISSTALSIVMRVFAVYINLRLACDYFYAGQRNYFLWTALCIVIPMFITTLMHANIYWKSLVYAIKCKRAELRSDKELQLKYFKQTIREESDIAFIRLFECFLEAAPQKILQISIVIGHIDKMTHMQIIAICSYFGSMAWCLSAYHRCNRYAQIDKNNINAHGLVLQLCWHFCISVSRTLCIAFVASVFPLWTLVACLCHALLFGFVTYIVDRPKFSSTSFINFLFCLILGIVYLFTYISVKDAPTRRKYIIYYVICSMENIGSISLFVLFASSSLVAIAFLFYTLCVMAIAFYYVGIVFMVIYYLYFHPKITVRQSKRINNN